MSNASFINYLPCVFKVTHKSIRCAGEKIENDHRKMDCWIFETGNAVFPLGMGFLSRVQRLEMRNSVRESDSITSLINMRI